MKEITEKLTFCETHMTDASSYYEATPHNGHTRLLKALKGSAILKRLTMTLPGVPGNYTGVASRPEVQAGNKKKQ